MGDNSPLIDTAASNAVIRTMAALRFRWERRWEVNERTELIGAFAERAFAVEIVCLLDPALGVCSRKGGELGDRLWTCVLQGPPMRYVHHDQIFRRATGERSGGPPRPRARATCSMGH